MLNENDIKRQKTAIEDLKALVEKADVPEEQKQQALQYCNGCIAACDIALGVGKKNEAPTPEPVKEEPSPMEQMAQSMIEATTGEKVTPTPAEATPVTSETEPTPEKKAPKKSRKKKAEPEPTPEPVKEEPPVQDTLDIDLDDLF